MKATSTKYNEYSSEKDSEQERNKEEHQTKDDMEIVKILVTDTVEAMSVVKISLLMFAFSTFVSTIKQI